MLRQGARILTLRRVNRVGLFIPSPIWAVPALGRFKVFSSRRISTESPPGLEEASDKKALPAVPTPSTEPWLEEEWEADAREYLEPLYSRGWGLAYEGPEWFERTREPVLVLRRTFPFSSTKDLMAFMENTRDAPSGDLIVFRGLKECDVCLRSRAGVTQSLISLAIETENEYEKIIGRNYAIPYVDPMFHAMTLSEAGLLAVEIAKDSRSMKPAPPPPSLPIAPVLLPPPPLVPASPPPSITEPDLEIYIEPLITNGWSIGGVKALARFDAARKAFRRLPSLNRVYRLRDYTSARHFFRAVVALIPPPTPASKLPDAQPGVEVRLTASERTVEVWSISELAESEPKPYGISLVDVRFAIQLENEFDNNWAQLAKNSVPSKPSVPKIIEQLWDYRHIPKTPPKPAPTAPRGEYEPKMDPWEERVPWEHRR
ncbi:hypothetical protein C8R44DRAFT_803325 [Mycena epipterygia]|nr:hypothetical protein C8R44DRAFT_803325 [Mycena epipterygia]